MEFFHPILSLKLFIWGFPQASPWSHSIPPFPCLRSGFSMLRYRSGTPQSYVLLLTVAHSVPLSRGRRKKKTKPKHQKLAVVHQ